ncbi:hypothetical protein [Streptomyces sp. NPDC001508]|uniref:hypothetical protein n=1 Tax=Streptomyces sp. NPDC001508 TaxID=3154656 RepID=UPI0033188BD1
MNGLDTPDAGTRRAAPGAPAESKDSKDSGDGGDGGDGHAVGGRAVAVPPGWGNGGAPTGTADEHVVRVLGTARVRTTVLHRPDGGHVWLRQQGPAHGAVLPRPGAATAASLSALSRGAPVRLALAEPGDAEWLRYRVPGVFSVVRLLHDPAEGTRAAIRDALHGVGAVLRLIHAVPAPAGAGTVPPGPDRLVRWLRSGDGPGASARLYEAALARLGPRRLGLVRMWCAGAADGPGARVLLHGGPALGALVMPADPGRPALLTGEELSCGSWEFDVTWLLAELAELARARERGIGGAPAADYPALAAAVTDGYGRRPSDGAVRRATALRILTHAHDFAAYVQWHAELLVYLDLAAEAVDAAEDGTPGADTP